MFSAETYIEQYGLHEHLNPDLLRCIKVFGFQAWHQLYSQSDELTFVYFLVSGTVQINHCHANGKVSVLARLRPLSIIGDLELFGAADIKTNVVTLEDTVLLGIEQAFVQRYGYDDPRFLRFVIQNLEQKLQLSVVLLIGNVLPVINRFASYVISQCDKHYRVALPPKAELAGMLGTTSRHLNRVINRLQAQGVIAVSGTMIQVVDYQTLEQYDDQRI